MYAPYQAIECNDKGTGQSETEIGKQPEATALFPKRYSVEIMYHM